MKQNGIDEDGFYTITISLNELIMIIFAIYYAYNFITFAGRNFLNKIEKT